MGAVKLSDTLVSSLTCPAGKKDVMFFDATLKGFGLRVTAQGARLFVYQYRIGPKVRRFKLGEWPRLTSGQARKLAEQHRGTVHTGGDPVAERRTKHAARLAEEAQVRTNAKVAAFTFDKLLDAWTARSLATRRESYRKDAPARLRTGLAQLLERPAASISRADAAEAVRAAAAERGPVGANRIMAYARACYGWGVKADLVQGNPFAGLPAPGRETARDRALSQVEVQAVWRATDALGAVQRAFVRFLLLTLQRRSEVAGARWQEFSADLTTWTIPAARAKNGRAHLVHLAPATRAVLEDVPRWSGQSLVFGLPDGEAGRLLTAFSSIKRTIDTRMAEDETLKGAPVPPWTLHDFRRTGVTRLAETGFPPHVCDRLLNHVTGAIQGVAAVYQRAEFLAERRAALEAWAGEVENGRRRA